MELLTLLNSIAEVTDWQVAKTGKSSTLILTSFFFQCKPGYHDNITIETHKNKQ